MPKTPLQYIYIAVAACQRGAASLGDSLLPEADTMPLPTAQRIAGSAQTPTWLPSV